MDTKRTIIGIENPHNLCYLNSILQLLFTIKPLNQFILKYFNNKNNITLDKYLILSYKYLLENIYTQDNSGIDEENILESTNFKDMLERNSPFPILNRQQDVHEILIIILNSFHEGLKSEYVPRLPRIKSSDNIEKYAKIKWKEYNEREKYSIVNNLFKGQHRTKITCQKCYCENNTFDSFIDITLPINNDTNTLEDCIEEMLIPEEIDEYFCCRCKKIVKAEKESIIWIFPKYLIFHINRFQNLEGVINKNNKEIEYPIKCLKFKDFTNSGFVNYNIKAMIRHHGNTQEFGHYTSTIFENDLIFTINDENIEKKFQNSNDIKNPYLLLYERV